MLALTSARGSVTRSAPGLVLAAAAGTALVAGVAGLPLAWDGSFFLFIVLNDQTPLLIANRYIETVLTAPVLIASAQTDDLAVLRTIFSLSYSVVPLVALSCSWLVVRRRPELFVWPVLGIALALLPGRALFIAESLIAAQLTWPILLAALVPVPRPVLVLCLGLGAVVTMSHPVAVVFLVTIALVGAAVRRESSWSRGSWMGAFLILAGLNVTLMGSRLNEFERQSLDLGAAAGTLVLGVLGPQLIALLLTALAAVLVIRAGRVAERAARIKAEAVALLSTALAGWALLVWAAIPEFWSTELAFRSWAVPVTVPLLVLAALDARSAADRRVPAVPGGRMWIATVAAVAMLLVVLVQSIVWIQRTSAVVSAVEGTSACVDAASIADIRGSALDHWSITPLSILLQGRDVRSFVASADACRTAEWPSEVVILEGTFRPSWFRFR